MNEIDRLSLEPRSLGRSDYPTELPFREVLLLAKHCAGGIILGFEQIHASNGTWKRGTSEERKSTKPISFPTPWNHIEAAILISLDLPVLVFREETISGGVFDAGVTDVFIHKMPISSMKQSSRTGLHEVILKWQAAVRTQYYADNRP